MYEPSKKDQVSFFLNGFMLRSIIRSPTQFVFQTLFTELLPVSRERLQFVCTLDLCALGLSITRLPNILHYRPGLAVVTIWV